MAQHDYVIANANGATVRADINNALLAISSTNSGSSEPSTPYAYEMWVDTSNNLLKLRNAANDGWITLGVSITASNTVDINGGAIDGTPIGASSASTGVFTTFTSNGIDDNADATAITIDSSENVSITGNLDAAKLTSNNGVLELDDNGSHNGIINVPASLFLNIDSDAGATTEYVEIAKDRTSTSGGTSLMKVQEDGNVGIGTESPAHQLDIRSSSVSADNFLTVGNSDSTKFLGLYGGTSSNALPTIYADSTSTALRFAYATDPAFNGFSEKMRLLVGGGLTFNGDTAAANALDDYEEGTWTPQLTDVGGNLATLSTANGSYTKIGRMILLNFNITLSSIASMTGDYTALTNLPFSHPTASYNGTGMVDYFSGLETAVSKIAIDSSSTATWMWLTFTSGSGGVSTGYLPVSYFGGNENIKGSVIYQTSV